MVKESGERVALAAAESRDVIDEHWSTLTRDFWPRVAQEVPISRHRHRHRVHLKFLTNFRHILLFTS